MFRITCSKKQSEERAALFAARVQAMIVTDRETPLGIVIVEKLRCGTAPAAA